MQDDDDNDDPMILNIWAKNHTSERTIVPWTVIFIAELSLTFNMVLSLEPIDIFLNFSFIIFFIKMSKNGN